MDDKRNLIIAVLLTGLILFGWPYVASTFFPSAIPVAENATAPTEGAPTDTPSGSATTGAAITSAAAAKNIPLGDALKGSARILIETPKLKGSVNLEGARIDDLQLLAHRTALPKDSPPVRIFAPSGTSKAHFARFGWVGKGIVAPDDKSVWTPSSNKLTPETPVTLSWINPELQKFEIILTVDKYYMITAEQRFTNGAATEAEVAPFGLLSRNGKSPDPDTWKIHVGPMGVFDGKIVNINYDEVIEAPKSELDYSTTGGWMGVTEMYWLTALVPDQKVKTNASFKTADGYYWTQMVNATQSKVAPGATMSQTSRLFAGAKEVETLDMYANKQGIPLLDYAIDWGWFWFIAIPFFWILHWLFGVFGNFGVAILGLTVIVRLFMFPVAQKQFASMAQMRAVQPKMKALQERLKDDKPRLQQEMMKLYKDEKVNPLAGCLPILLQIPIFFALYKILMLSIEMRHQPFALWLKDLSAPDPLTPVNLFGLIPFDPPTFLAIGVLPILLGVTMWLMQKLNPQPMDEVQKQVFAIMPWFLMFIMAPFAAGLQLYWVMSNVISIAQQKWLYSRHPILKEQMAKEAEEKAREKAKAGT
ncbi:membrane protein insertase YidC [Sphingorhabdus sp.]|uniref:membrane protein insertase YidC n=1 Tax=Sphingorhabdus sp. TaxID=1902408 RepID=UPI0035944D5A